MDGCEDGGDDGRRYDDGARNDGSGDDALITLKIEGFLELRAVFAIPGEARTWSPTAQSGSIYVTTHKSPG